MTIVGATSPCGNYSSGIGIRGKGKSGVSVDPYWFNGLGSYALHRTGPFSSCVVLDRIPDSCFVGCFWASG